MKYGKDHNIVLVDNQGPEFFLDGLIEAPPNSDGFLHDHAVDGALTSFAASTKYAQAELRRRVVRLARASALGLEREETPDVFVIADTLISETSRRYTFQLNGLASELIGSTSFTSSAIAHGGRATWTRPNAALHAVMLAMVDPTVESRLEESSLASGQHRCFTVSADMHTGAGFLTVLVPAPSGAEIPTITSRRLATRVLGKRIRIIVTPTSAWRPGVGGVSYTGSFTWSDDTPGFVLSDRRGTAKMIAECVSHESGHTVGLSHQSRYNGNCTLSETYHSGNGTGETGWAPVMGNSYNRNMTGWNDGPTPYGCANTQDNLTIITTQNGFTYGTDDYSDNADETATVLNNSFSKDGIITTGVDKDAFKYVVAQNSTFHMDVMPYSVGTANSGANLDVQVQLYNAATLIKDLQPRQ